ncbi:MAG: carboxymuconolactone decarboxylase family protein [Mycolicibacterium sp.]|uniref:carboxymuconolactone decarboxylase family protein n=1 Tax=Mycolicibacterium sp. TaxID=2320850 RepID=UPI003D0D998F
MAISTPSAAESSAPADGTSLGQAYHDLFGEVPPHARRRWEILEAVGRGQTVIALENLRSLVISKSPLELRVQQLVQFGQLLVIRAEGPARLHARAAIRHGATLQELMAVSETAYLTGGITAFSLGVTIIGELLDEARDLRQ